MIFDVAYDWVEAEIEGRIATPRESCRVLIEYIKDFRGDHVEIGALYGGTAILTALCKSDGMIFTIDPVDEHGYYGKNDQLINGKPSRPNSEILRRNIDHFGVKDRIVHVNAFSHPFPVKDVIFDSAFVDGDHTFEGAYQDFLSLRNIVAGPVIYDNADDLHDGVKEAISKIVTEHGWMQIKLEHNVAVLRRAWPLTC